MRAAYSKLLALCGLCSTVTAKAVASRAVDIPTSVRLFTVRAFESPYLTGQGLTGYVMNAHDGSFWLSPTGGTAAAASPSSTPCVVGGYGSPSCRRPPLTPRPNTTETVLWVNGDGRAFLASGANQRVYIDTFNGHLSYERPSVRTTPGGAMFALFVHRGHGTATYGVVPPFNYTTEAPGTFAWVGSDHDYWFACPAAGGGGGGGGEYSLHKLMGYGDRALDNCTVLSLAAIDWNGATPVVDAYA